MDAVTRTSLLALSAAFVGVAAMIRSKQKTAASCDLHSRSAGNVAMVLSVCSAVTGLILLAIAAIA